MVLILTFLYEDDIMEDYEYYQKEMKKGTVSIIQGQGAMEENLLLGRILTWLPRKIISLFKKKDNNIESED